MSEEKAADAQTSYEWLEAYVAAGFTREEAMQILCRPWVTIKHAQAQYPPEMYEFWERQNAVASKMIIDMNDDD